MNRVLDSVTGDLGRGWDHASTAERGLVVGWGVVTAASLTPLFLNADTRMGILEFLEGKDIPVPGVTGLSLNIGPRGGGGSWDNFLVPGLGIAGGAQAPKTGESGVQWNARVTFDFAEFFRSPR